jgi:hypothetical protein
MSKTDDWVHIGGDLEASVNGRWVHIRTEGAKKPRLIACRSTLAAAMKLLDERTSSSLTGAKSHQVMVELDEDDWPAGMFVAFAANRASKPSRSSHGHRT